MNIRKVIYILYILLIIFFIGYSIYNGFYESKYGNFTEKKITAKKVYSNVLRGGGINYTIVDRENNTYFFSTSEISKILNDYEVSFGESSIFIKYNIKNNEIIEVSDGNLTEKSKFFSWTFFIICLSILASIMLIIYLGTFIRIKISKKSIEMNMHDTE